MNRRNLEVECNEILHTHSCIFVDFQGLSQELFGHWVDIEFVDNTISTLGLNFSDKLFFVLGSPGCGSSQ